MKRMIWIVLLALVFVTSNSVFAAVLFTENWDTSGGVIDPNNGPWAAIGDDILLEDLGGGDYALALRGSQDGGTPGWSQDQIYSTATYDRGSQLSVKWTVWIKPGINVQVSIHGGWHHTNVGPVYGNDLANSPEATFGYVVNDLRAYESGDGFQATGSAVPMPSFTSALTDTSDKSNALQCRVVLGNTSGARWEWSSNGGATWTVERDTIDSGTSSQVSNWIGFGPFAGQAGTTLIDDIVVEELPAGTINISESGGSTDVDEDRTITDTYSVVLGGIPAQNVTVTITPDAQLDINGAGGGVPVDLTFTPGNAETPQVVNVQAVDDLLEEANHTGTIAHTSTSADQDFDGLVGSNVVVNIDDNEIFCGQDGQVYDYYDTNGPLGEPDCVVNFFDAADFFANWLNCTDASGQNCI